jgi:hypothetical protein
MEPPRVADGGDGLEIWRVVANILNKQSLTADEGWYYSLEVKENSLITKCYNRASDFRRIFSKRTK